MKGGNRAEIDMFTANILTFRKNRAALSGKQSFRPASVSHCTSQLVLDRDYHPENLSR